MTDVTRSAGLEGIVHTHGGVGEAWAPEIVGAGGGFVDYDGDGWGDIIVATGGAFAEMPPLGAHPALRLFRNQHDGTFAEVTHAAGLAGLRAYTFGITAADYDNDGDQDLYVSTLYRDLLLRNDRGVFTDVGAGCRGRHGRRVEHERDVLRCRSRRASGFVRRNVCGLVAGKGHLLRLRWRKSVLYPRTVHRNCGSVLSQSGGRHVRLAHGGGGVSERRGRGPRQDPGRGGTGCQRGWLAGCRHCQRHRAGYAVCQSRRRYLPGTGHPQRHRV